MSTHPHPVWRSTALCLVGCLLLAGVPALPGALSDSPRDPVLPLARDARETLFLKAKSVALTAQELFELSVACFEVGEITEAATTARLGIGVTKSAEEKAAFLAVLSQCLSVQGRYQVAAETALEGSRLNPASKELAALRIAYFEKLGDKANSLAARDHLRRLDPTVEGKPVSEWVDDLQTIILIYQTIKVIYETARESWIRLEPQIRDTVEQMKKTWPKILPRRR